ncbi:hypothetical protein [Burkholderia cenocepacia]|uniref:hypothetical protein n=1 Tax=Burkholderia cenocepacia TaxID=95486 RepID=UPI000A74A28D|nr:hypothetical protein [Burkholderia cenocepacia]
MRYQIDHKQIAPKELMKSSRDTVVFAYNGPGTIPVVAAWPLDETLWRPFVDADTGKNLVTYAASVPLETVLRGREAVAGYVAQAFDGGVTLSDVEYRVIGGGTEGGGWDNDADGDVVLQVSCTLSAAV